jgi:hypothetical protein
LSRRLGPRRLRRLCLCASFIVMHAFTCDSCSHAFQSPCASSTPHHLHRDRTLTLLHSYRLSSVDSDNPLIIHHEQVRYMSLSGDQG